MKRKFNMIFGAVFLCMAVISQVLAVTYAPNKNENIIKDNISTLDRVFTQEDIDKVLEIYKSNLDVTDEELEMYDLDKNGIINSLDASLMYDHVVKN